MYLSAGRQEFVSGLWAAPAQLLRAQQVTVRLVELQPLLTALAGDTAIQ